MLVLGQRHHFQQPGAMERLRLEGSTDVCHPGRERVPVDGESPMGSMTEGSRSLGLLGALTVFWSRRP